MSIGNKKISQLVELIESDVLPDNLLVIIDTNAKESKKIKVSELSSWFNSNGSIESSSYAATSSWTYNIVGGGIIPSSVASSSWASSSVSSSYAVSASYASNGGGSGGVIPGNFYDIKVSWASSSVSSSWSTCSIYSDTSSFLYYIPGGNNGTASYAMVAGTVLTTSASWASSSISSSYSISSSWTDNSTSSSYSINSDTASISNTSSYLFYDGITENGTASYSISSSWASSSILADTASYFNNAIGKVASAIWSDTSGISNSSSYLIYSPNNGTASYAMATADVGTTGVGMNVFGLFYPTLQTTNSAYINVLSVDPSAETMISVRGNVIVNYTSSVTMYPSLSLFMMNINNGNKYTLDTSIIAFNIRNVINGSGSYNTPFELSSQIYLDGYYYVYLTSSWSGLKIDANRYVKFSLNSYSDNLVIDNSDELPTSPVILPKEAQVTFYMTGSGPYQDSASNMIRSGSNKVSYLDMSNLDITDVKYTYNFSTMSYFNCSKNLTLTSLDYGFPSTLDTLLCYSCSLTSIYDLSSTNITNIICSYNNFSYLPTLPSTTTYLDCSNNPLIDLIYFPSNLQTIISDGTLITSIPRFPDSLVTASFSGSTIVTPPIYLPTSMSYINLMGNPIESMPTMGVSCSYVNVSYCSLTISILINMTNDLITNDQLNGTLDIRGYGAAYDPTLLLNLTTLIMRGWTILIDP